MTSLRIGRGTTTSIAIFFGVLSLAFMAATPANAQRARPTTDAVDLGPVAGDTPVEVTVYLAPDPARIAALDQFLAALQDPASADYHRWLTPAQFGASFGANAAALASVQSYAERMGLHVGAVSATGTRVTLDGTAMQMEDALSPALHGFQVGAQRGVMKTAEPLIPAALSAAVTTVGGFRALHSRTVATDDLLAALSQAEDDNTAVVALADGGCMEDVSTAYVQAFQFAAKAAAAQGMTVLAASGCATGSSGFPGALAEVTSVAEAPGLTKAPAGMGLRPLWQRASGLPEDGLRHEPDLTAVSLNALQQTLAGIAASLPSSGDGPASRLGNVSAALYAIAPTPGLYTQPDGAAPGTWEPGTGLGLVDLAALAQVFPRGTLADNVSISSSNYSPTHGQSITLTSSVTDISGQGRGAVPTGTVTFTTSSGLTLGSATLVNGTGSITLNTLAGGNYSLTATYSGDATYAANHSVVANQSVIGEPTALSASTTGSVAVGGTITVNVVAQSPSGVGTPSGTVTVQDQGSANSTTYSGTLSGTNGTATATVTLPATQAGNESLLVSCVSADPSFTCFTPAHTNVTITPGATQTTLSVSPNPPVAGQTTTFTAIVTGAAAPAPTPTGNVNFFDNGNQIGTAVLTNGTATYTNTGIDATTGHTFTAAYVGDNNYTVSTSAGITTSPTQKPTTTTLTVSPNPPVAGATTTLSATVGFTSTGAVPTGSVTFFEDGTQVGTATVGVNAVATFTSTTITGTSSHTFFAKYNGDTNYGGSTSATVTTQGSAAAAVATTTTVAASATAVATGGSVTFTATVVPASTVNGVAPTGTVTFTSSVQGALGTVALSAGTATLTAPLSTAGAQNITATYSGDTNYKSSTSATPLTVTVGGTASGLTLTVTPATGAPFGSPVTVVATVAGVTTTNGAAPAGTVTLTVSGPTSGSTTVGLTPTSTTASSASTTIAAPAPGTYTITATCTGANFTCPTTPATATLVTVKGNTVTTLSAAPAVPIAGQPTVLTATITPATPTTGTTNTFTGTVTFYINGVAAGTGTVTGNQATFSTTLSTTTPASVTAVYSGDADWNTSTSPALSLVNAPVSTTGTLAANVTTALQGTNIIFTASFSVTPNAANPNPGTPTGTVAFYDLYNGQTVLLGTAQLVASGPTLGSAQLSTTGLFHGLHSVTAVLGSTAALTGSTTNAVTVTITDYSLTFTPASLTIAQGQTGTATLTVVALNGFTGTVALGCTPPAGTQTTCSFNPTVLSTSGTSTLTITTTASPHARGTLQAGLRNAGLGISLAAAIGCVLLPKRRRLPMLALLVLCGLIGVAGCGTQLNNTGGGAGGTTGSPLGTQVFTIFTSGSDGVTTTRHNLSFQVVIQ